MRALELESQVPNRGITLGSGLAKKGMSGSVDRFATPSECQNVSLLQQHVLDDSHMPCAFFFLPCCGGWKVGRLAALVHRFSCNSAYI